MKKFVLLILLCSSIFLPINVLAEEEITPPEEVETPEVTTYTVTFDSDGGSSIESQTIEEGKTVARPSNPTKEGYTFKEWQLDGKTYTFLETVTANITLKAVWEENAPTIDSSYLSSLAVKDYTFKEGSFDKDKTKYTLTVPSDVSQIMIEATPDENSIIFKQDDLGTQNLKYGSNTFTIITALSGSNDKTKTYTIMVTREKADITLASLRIVGHVFKETFQSDLYHYSVEVPYDVEEVEVQAVASSHLASVDITGEDDIIVDGSKVSNLVVGDNTITITVSNDGNRQVYSVTITRLKEDEEANTTSSIESEGVVSPLRDDDGKDVRNYILLTIGTLLAVVMVGLGIYFFIKSKEKKPKQKTKPVETTSQEAEPTNQENLPPAEEVPLIEEVKDNSPTIEQPPIVEILEDLEDTKEAPVIDHSDILDGIESLFDDDK